MMSRQRIGRQLWSCLLGAVLAVSVVCTGTPAIAAEGQGGKAALEATSWLLTAPYGVFIELLTVAAPENLTGERPLHFIGKGK